MNYINKLFFFLFVFLTLGATAQENPEDAPTDDLGDVTDEFQEYFFEALKQKAIENYELALEALQKAEKATKESESELAVVQYEKAKNLVELRRYDEAEMLLEQVLVLQEENLDVMESLYDLFYRTRNYDKAIPLVLKLVKKDPEYKEDLANLYTRVKKYDEALEILDDLDAAYGETPYRDTLRASIYKQTGNNEAQITTLESKVEANPKKEQDYLNLIYLYSEEGNNEKAFATAKELLKNNPKSELVHLALYKFYLQSGETESAIQSMKKVFVSSKIEKENKYRVIGDFISFVESNPSYEAQLETIVADFSQENGQVYEKLGDYYVVKNRKEDALAIYEKGIANDQDNYSLLKKTLILQIELQRFKEAANLSENALDIFPAQPLLYLFNGVANNGLQASDKAIDILEIGVDYIIENPIMEKDFYTQLEKAYLSKGNTKKAAEYAKKAQNIVIE